MRMKTKRIVSQQSLWLLFVLILVGSVSVWSEWDTRVWKTEYYRDASQESIVFPHPTEPRAQCWYTRFVSGAEALEVVENILTAQIAFSVYHYLVRVPPMKLIYRACNREMGHPFDSIANSDCIEPSVIPPEVFEAFRLGNDLLSSPNVKPAHPILRDVAPPGRELRALVFYLASSSFFFSSNSASFTLPSPACPESD